MKSTTFCVALGAALLQVSTAGGPMTTEFPTLETCKPAAGSNLNVVTPILIKEAAGVDFPAHPFHISVVVPLKKSQYQNTDSFLLVHPDGSAVPAQFDVLERYWSADNSLRHVKIHLRPYVEAYRGPNTGTLCLLMIEKKPGQAEPDIFRPVTVTKPDSNSIRLNNQKVAIDIKKNPFSISTPIGPMNITFTGQTQADVQKSFELFNQNPNSTIEVETEGPIYSVIRIEVPTVYQRGVAHKHGWAMRIHAYNDATYVKFDFQLQNSAPTVFSGPLYFNSLRVEVGKDLPTASGVRSAKAEALYEDPNGKPAVGVTTGYAGIAIRNFYETWPNEISEENGRLVADLWPEWGAQYHNTQTSPTGLYWLDDMQHAYKEILVVFKLVQNQEQINALANVFQFPPVGVLPKQTYLDTRATLDFGGFFSDRASVPDSDSTRKPVYETSHYSRSSNYQKYQFGWNNFRGNTYRRFATSMGGGTPYYNAKFMLSGNPKDLFYLANFALGELNMRPQWLSGYDYATDQSTLKLTANPYAGVSWRKLLTSYSDIKKQKELCGCTDKYLDKGYIDGTTYTAKARDQQHGWFYNFETAYFLTGNPWIKDWYKFMGQFVRIYLNRGDPFPDKSSRAMGHSIALAVSAYRATGDKGLLGDIRGFVTDYLKPGINPVTGGKELGGVNLNGALRDAPFMVGYLGRGLVNYYYENNCDQVAMDIVKKLVNWNFKYAQFSYYYPVVDVQVREKSAGASRLCVDLQAYVARLTGNSQMWEQLETFIKQGLNGGNAAGTGGFTGWTGDFMGRLYDYAKYVDRIE